MQASVLTDADTAKNHSRRPRIFACTSAATWSDCKTSCQTQSGTCRSPLSTLLLRWLKQQAWVHRPHLLPPLLPLPLPSIQPCTPACPWGCQGVLMAPLRSNGSPNSSSNSINNISNSINSSNSADQGCIRQWGCRAVDGRFLSCRSCPCQHSHFFLRAKVVVMPQTWASPFFPCFCNNNYCASRSSDSSSNNSSSSKVHSAPHMVDRWICPL